MRAAAARLPRLQPSCFLSRLLETEFSRGKVSCLQAQRLHTVSKTDVLVEDAKRENWRRRVDLAACYRGFEKYGLHEGVCNHLSMMAPAVDGRGQVMLLIPYGLHWSEVRASSFVGLNERGEVVEGNGKAEISAATIHLGVHNTRQDAVCVFHLHPPYCTAIGSLKNPELRMCHQNSCRFYNCIAYDRDYSGLSQDDEEGMRTGRQLGDKSVLFMCNHGVLVVAETAAKAFDDIYYLERACMTQVLALTTGEELFELPEELVSQVHEQFHKENDVAKMNFSGVHFKSVKRILAEENPDFME